MASGLALVGALFAALLSAAPARAGDWVVCDYDVQSLRIGGAPRELTVRLLKGRPRNLAECPPATGELSFTPETPDYQSTLPRAQWPKPGRQALLRYRHLDGVCKDAGPCRIRHFSILPAS